MAHRTIKARDLGVFYREAMPKDAPAVLLLQGFPTSSQMLRTAARARSRLPRLRSQFDAAAGRVRAALPVPLGELRSDGEAGLECKNRGSYDDQPTCAQASQN